MKRYLIAGGAGFIGSHLVDQLLKEHAHVTVIDNLVTGSRTNLSLQDSNKDLEFLEIDITKALPRLDDYDIVLHLASVANPVQYEVHQMDCLLVNSVGSKNLLEVAGRSNARYVFFSSSEIYGGHDQSVGALTETSPSIVHLNHKRSPYFIGKMYAEEMARTYCEAAGLDFLIVRPFNIYGPKMDVNARYGRVIPNFIKWAVSGEPLKLNGDGRQKRSFCHVEDLVGCVTRLLKKPVFEHKVVNIGTPEPITIRELADMINTLAGNRAGITFTERYEYEPFYRNPDIDLVRQWVSWEPRIKLRDGLSSMIEEEIVRTGQEVRSHVPDEGTYNRIEQQLQSGL